MRVKSKQHAFAAEVTGGFNHIAEYLSVPHVNPVESALCENKLMKFGQFVEAVVNVHASANFAILFPFR
jgi:hypothetical protein